MNYFAKNMKLLRMVLGMSQDQLAQHLGVNRHNIASYERDSSKPNVSIMLQIADLFGVDLGLMVQEDLSKKEYKKHTMGKTISDSTIKKLLQTTTTPTAEKVTAPTTNGPNIVVNMPQLTSNEDDTQLQILHQDVHNIATNLERIADLLEICLQKNKKST